MESVYADLLRADMDESGFAARLDRKRRKAARLGCLTAAVAVFRARDAVKQTHDFAVRSLAALLPPIYRLAASWDPAVDTTNDAVDALVNLFFEGAHLKTSASFHAVVVVADDTPVPDMYSPLPSPVVFGSATKSPNQLPSAPPLNGARIGPTTPPSLSNIKSRGGSCVSTIGTGSLSLSRKLPTQSVRSYASSYTVRRVSSANLPASPLSLPSSRYQRFQRRWTRHRAEFKQKREAAKAAKVAQASAAAFVVDSSPVAESVAEPVTESEPEQVTHRKIKLPWRRSALIEPSLESTITSPTAA